MVLGLLAPGINFLVSFFFSLCLWRRVRDSNPRDLSVGNFPSCCNSHYANSPLCLVLPDGFEPSSVPCQSTILPLNYGSRFCTVGLEPTSALSRLPRMFHLCISPGGRVVQKVMESNHCPFRDRPVFEAGYAPCVLPSICSLTYYLSHYTPYVRARFGCLPRNRTSLPLRDGMQSSYTM